ncbi:MAG: hypothetical protein ACTSSD_18625 [Candidatus Thorarchaeota archaeon]
MKTTQNEIIDKYWVQDIIPISMQDSHIQSKIDVIRENQATRIAEAEESYNTPFQKRLFVIPYLFLLVLFSIILSTDILLLPTSDIIFSPVEIIPFPLASIVIIDFLAMRYDLLRKLVFGTAHPILEILFALFLSFLITSVWGLASLFLPTSLIAGRLVIIYIVALVPTTLAALGLKPWKFLEEFSKTITSHYRMQGKLLITTILVREAMEQTLPEFLLFCKEYDLTNENESPTELKEIVAARVLKILQESEKAFSWNPSRENRPSAFDSIQELNDKSMDDLKSWCIEKYLDALETRGHDKNLLRITFSLIDTDFLRWIVSFSKESLRKKSIVTEALKIRLKRIYPDVKSNIAIDVLAELASSLFINSVKDNAVYLGQILAKVASYSVAIEQLDRFFEYSNELHTSSEVKYSCKINPKKISKKLLSRGIAVVDWNLIENLYGEFVKEGLHISIVEGCKGIHGNPLIQLEDVIELSLKSNKNAKQELPILFSNYLKRFGDEDPNFAILSKILTDSLIVDNATMTEIRRSIDLADKTAKLLPKIENRISHLQAGSVKENELSHIFQCPESESLLLTSAIFAMRYKKLTLPKAIVAVLPLVQDSIKYQDRISLFDYTFKEMNTDDRIAFLSLLCAESLKGIEQINDTFNQVDPFLKIVASTICEIYQKASGKTILDSFREIIIRVEQSLEYFEVVTGIDWYEAIASLTDESIEPLKTIIGSEVSTSLVSLGIGLASKSLENDSNLTNVEKGLSFVDDEVLLVSFLRFWYGITKKDLQPREIIRGVLDRRCYTTDMGNEDTTEIIQNTSSIFATMSTESLIQQRKGELRFLENQLKVKYLNAVLDNRKLVSERLNILNEIWQALSHVLVYVSDYNIIDITQLTDTSFSSLNEIELDNQIVNKSQLSYNLLKDVIQMCCEGGDDESYVKFLLAVILNSASSPELVKIDELSRKELISDPKGLEFALIFRDMYGRKRDPLILPYSQMESLRSRHANALVTEKDRILHHDDINDVRENIDSGGLWVNRLGFLTPSERVIRQSQKAITKSKILKDLLENENDRRMRAARIAINIAHSRIKDSDTIEYVSSRTYNYFLLSWHTKMEKEAESTFGKIVDKWISKNSHLLGEPVQLGNVTRIGKIPTGKTFRTFTKWVAEELSSLCEKSNVIPRVFLVCWSPTPFSAHALSNIESADWDTVDAIRRVFDGASQSKISEINEFIEQSVVNQLTIPDQLTALDASWDSFMKRLNRDFLGIEELAEFSHSQQEFFKSKFKPLIMKALGVIRDRYGNLESASMHPAYLENVDDVVKQVFKGKRKTNQKQAQEVLVALLEGIRALMDLNLPAQYTDDIMGDEDSLENED